MQPDIRHGSGGGDAPDPLSVRLGDGHPGRPVDVRSLVMEVSDELGIVLGDGEQPSRTRHAEPVVPPMLADPELADIVSRIMQRRTAKEKPSPVVAAAAAPEPEPTPASATEPAAAQVELPAAPVELPVAAPDTTPDELPVAAPDTTPVELPVAAPDTTPDELPVASLDATLDDGLDAAMDSETFRRHREQLFHPPAKKNDSRLWKIAAAVTIILLVLLAFTAYRSGTFNRLLPDGWKSRPPLPGRAGDTRPLPAVTARCFTGPVPTPSFPSTDS